MKEFYKVLKLQRDTIGNNYITYDVVADNLGLENTNFDSEAEALDYIRENLSDGPYTIMKFYTT